jgi:hypothetical protein
MNLPKLEKPYYIPRKKLIKYIMPKHAGYKRHRRPSVFNAGYKMVKTAAGLARNRTHDYEEHVTKGRTFLCYNHTERFYGYIQT